MGTNWRQSASGWRRSVGKKSVWRPGTLAPMKRLWDHPFSHFQGETIITIPNACAWKVLCCLPWGVATACPSPCWAHGRGWQEWTLLNERLLCRHVTDTLDTSPPHAAAKRSYSHPHFRPGNEGHNVETFAYNHTMVTDSLLRSGFLSGQPVH